MHSFLMVIVGCLCCCAFSMHVDLTVELSPNVSLSSLDSSNETQLAEAAQLATNHTDSSIDSSDFFIELMIESNATIANIAHEGIQQPVRELSSVLTTSGSPASNYY